MCSCHSILEFCVTFSGVKLSIRSFVLFMSELSIKFLINNSRSVAGKLIEIKKPPENLFITPEGHKISTNSSDRYCFQQCTYWLQW